jgi:hypothetical protein
MPEPDPELEELLHARSVIVEAAIAAANSMETLMDPLLGGGAKPPCATEEVRLRASSAIQGR